MLNNEEEKQQLIPRKELKKFDETSIMSVILIISPYTNRLELNKKNLKCFIDSKNEWIYVKELKGNSGGCFYVFTSKKNKKIMKFDQYHDKLWNHDLSLFELYNLFEKYINI